MQRGYGRALPQLWRRIAGPPAPDKKGVNYRHAFHAGNFADVMKHAALVSALEYLKKKDKPFRVIDTHAGRGLYDLSGREAAKTREAVAGIVKLREAADVPPALKTYLDLVRGFGDHYPGSPLIAARILRPIDKLTAIEKHPEEYMALADALRQHANVRVEDGDGYARLAAVLPPPERRGLVLIDPPYEAENEFALASAAVAGALRRFATGVYLVWFPIKRRSDADALAGELLTAGATKLLLLTLNIGGDATERLTESGMLVVNPPYGFDAEMRETLAFLAKHLAQGEGAGSRVEWLAGGAG